MKGTARRMVRSGFRIVLSIDLTSCGELEAKTGKKTLPQRALREIKSSQRRDHRLNSLCSQFPYLCDLCVNALELSI
jgi:hypothetical protein